MSNVLGELGRSVGYMDEEKFIHKHLNFIALMHDAMVMEVAFA